jgi:hypothetical protein
MILLIGLTKTESDILSMPVKLKGTLILIAVYATTHNIVISFGYAY